LPWWETYVTLENVSIDRCASAWFIQRFVDDQAKFVFFQNGETPPSGIGYDYYGAPFFRRGPDSTFARLVKAHHKQSNPALRKIYEEANDVSAWKKGPESLTAKLLNLIAERREKVDDEAVYRDIFPLFDLLYLSHGANTSDCLPSQQGIVESAPQTILDTLKARGTLFPDSPLPSPSHETRSHKSAMRELSIYLRQKSGEGASLPELQRQILEAITNETNGASSTPALSP
jgi:hypothetical protein